MSIELWFGLRPLTKCIITRGSYGQCSGEPAQHYPWQMTGKLEGAMGSVLGNRHNTTPGRGQRPS